MEVMQHDPTVTIAELARIIGVTNRAIKKQIEKLKQQGRLRRVGPARGGHWEVL
ncbi:MAG TPA: HTH domain-containing protein [Methanoculleus sp.]|uniref:HTH domain-containing protein n=1 Tax=Methanoculleus sp. TaxID=90427 RepID=UPI002BAE8FF8|nr:HTH domain-containing protein [Methanoculleus sp.]HOC85109.1 HTH domain-containing protein [Methanoculleus sp.]HQL60590.1 HTH domain-containing protein [Methanoculleus sp.]